MKNLQEIQAKCLAELERTYPERSMSPGNSHLWYCETSESVIGNIAVAREQPFGGWTIADKVRDNLTNEGNVQYWTSHRILSRLPVLS